jgi:hypothetical protein
MATTTNYGWDTPDDTDLVKDGAAAIRTLGSSVDTTTKALNPSTTLGDIEYRSATANTNTRLGIGSTGNILTVAGGVPTWAAPAASGGMTLISTTTFSNTASVLLTSIPQTYKHLYLTFQSIRMATNNEGGYIDNLGGSTVSATWVGRRFNGAAETLSQRNSTSFGYVSGSDLFGIVHGPNTTVTRELGFGDLLFPNYTNALAKFGFSKCAWVDGSSGNWRSSEIWANTGTTAAITSMDIYFNANVTSGTLLVYGVS